MLVEHFLCLKPAELYFRGINTLSDEWQEAIQINGEECSPMLQETGVQSQVESYQKLKNGT